LIDFCIKHQAGTFILIDQQEKVSLAKEEAFVLRNWSYCDLMTKIKYKAEKAGIELITD
jgi:transposase